MEIYIAEEKVFYYPAQFTPEVARDRVEQKKTGLVAGAVGALISRPKPDEIQFSAAEYRYEPYWMVNITSRTRFERNRTFTFPVSGSEVQSVILMGQVFPLDPRQREPAVTLDGVEQCLEENHASRSCDALEGKTIDLSRCQNFQRLVVEDLENFVPRGWLVTPPRLKASAVVRQVMSQVLKPAQNAHLILEEKVEVSLLELLFLPVYAFEFEWSAKNKRSVVEFDALSGDLRSSGRKLQEQVKGMLSRDLIFDVTADAVGLIVPGGSIAVKLVKAAVDSGKK